MSETPEEWARRMVAERGPMPDRLLRRVRAILDASDHSRWCVDCDDEMLPGEAVEGKCWVCQRADKPPYQ